MFLKPNNSGNIWQINPLRTSLVAVLHKNTYFQIYTTVQLCKQGVTTGNTVSGLTTFQLKERQKLTIKITIKIHLSVVSYSYNVPPNNNHPKCQTQVLPSHCCWRAQGRSRGERCPAHGAAHPNSSLWRHWDPQRPELLRELQAASLPPSWRPQYPAASVTRGEGARGAGESTSSSLDKCVCECFCVTDSACRWSLNDLKCLCRSSLVEILRCVASPCWRSFVLDRNRMIQSVRETLSEAEWSAQEEEIIFSYQNVLDEEKDSFKTKQKSKQLEFTVC